MATAKLPGALVALDESEKEPLELYKKSQAELLAALEGRQNRMFDPTLLAMAQGFLAPTKYGTFGESLGNVAGALGPVQEAEDKRTREMAMLRMEIAKQQLEQTRAERGQAELRRLSKNNFMVPEGPEAGATSGQPSVSGGPDATVAAATGAAPASTGPRMRPVNAADLIRLPPDVQKTIMDAVKFDQDRYKVDAGLVIDTRAPGGPKVVTDLRVGKQEPTEIVVRGESMMLNLDPVEAREFRTAQSQGKGDQYYDQFLKGRKPVQPSAGGALQEASVFVPGMEEPINIRVTPRQAAEIERLQEQAIKSGNPKPLVDFLSGIGRPLPAAQPSAELRGALEGTAEPAKTEPAKPGQRKPAPVASDLGPLPYADQVKVIADRLAASDKGAQADIETLMKSASPMNLQPSNNRLREINRLVKENPKAVGLLAEQGLATALASAAQEGIRVGSYSISAPAEEFLRKLNLSVPEQAVARRLTQLLDEEFFARAQMYKSALGPQMSNADAIFMKSPLAQTRDPAALIEYWGLYNILNNKMMDEMYRSLNTWQDRTKGRAPARQFFNNEGRAVLEKYSKYFNELETKLAPRR